MCIIQISTGQALERNFTLYFLPQNIKETLNVYVKKERNQKGSQSSPHINHFTEGKRGQGEEPW